MVTALISSRQDPASVAECRGFVPLFFCSQKFKNTCNVCLQHFVLRTAGAGAHPHAAQRQMALKIPQLLQCPRHPQRETEQRKVSSSKKSCCKESCYPKSKKQEKRRCIQETYFLTKKCLCDRLFGFSMIKTKLIFRNLNCAIFTTSIKAIS